MKNLTRQALRASLKQLLREKPLEKITITELSAHCGISRMTFYYHFRDIYDLVEWVCVEDLQDVLRGVKEDDTWQDKIRRILEAAYEEKTYIQSLTRAMKREQIEAFWLTQSAQLIREAIDAETAAAEIPHERLSFLTDFYKCGFVGILLDWFDQNMKTSCVLIADDLITLIESTIAQAVSAFIKRQEV